MTESPTPPAPVSPAPEAPSPAARARWAPWRVRTLRWATGLLIVFALGLGALWLVQVRPLRQQVAALEQQRDSLQASETELQEQVARLEGVEAENEELRAAKATLEQHCALLKATAGALGAQFVLASGGDTAQAAEALSGADGQLALLEAMLTGTPQEDVRAMRYRLAMAAEETESDPFAAQRDLEVLANGLETMDEDLFGG